MSPQSTLEPVQCPRCRGSHFQKASFRQYLAGTYSSGPGGELCEASSPINMLVCLCGEPVPDQKVVEGNQSAIPPGPGRRAQTPNSRGPRHELRKSLEDSLGKAKQFRKSTELSSIIVGLIGKFATKAELQTIKESLESFGAALACMEKKP